jgi:hypothetical protein
VGVELNDLHVLFAEAKKLTNHSEFVVIGSLSILGVVQGNAVPARMLISIDVDCYTRQDPERIYELKKALGRGHRECRACKQERRKLKAATAKGQRSMEDKLAHASLCNCGKRSLCAVTHKAMHFSRKLFLDKVQKDGDSSWLMHRPAVKQRGTVSRGGYHVPIARFERFILFT